MIGQKLTCPAGTGVIDAEAIHPDGMVIVRINDQWFPLSLCHT